MCKYFQLWNFSFKCCVQQLSLHSLNSQQKSYVERNNPMEEVLEKLKLPEVSFRTPKKESICKSCRTWNKIPTRAQKHLSANEGFRGIHEQPLESLSSPNNAMEYLCRPWSPSASHLLQSFSSTNHRLQRHDRDTMEDQEEQVEDTLTNTAETNTTLAFNGNRKFHFNHLKGWLRGKQLTGFFRPSKEKRKEETRFHTARLDAALSITRLSAAIAGFTTSLSTEIHDTTNPKNNRTSGLQYKGMGSVVAMAATLMTTVCAEAAESLGANRAQVESAVNSGVAVTNPNDMIAVTATATTCLRGAEILKSRRVEEAFPRIEDILGAFNQIRIITPSGRKEYRCVTIYSKHKHLILCIRQKYFGGTLTTSKEHRIIQIKETMEGQGLFFLILKTNNGEIRLLFEEEKQLRIWKSTIDNLVKLHNPHNLSGSSQA